MSSRRNRAFLAGAALVVVVLAFVVSRYASSKPDGLERVATDRGFIGQARDSATVDSPLADYAVRGVADEGLSVGLSGIIGVAAVFVLMGGVVYGFQRRPASSRVASA